MSEPAWKKFVAELRARRTEPGARRWVQSEALGALLLRIREQTGATLLVIEHDVPLLLGIADRVVALDLGEVIAILPWCRPRWSRVPPTRKE